MQFKRIKNQKQIYYRGILCPRSANPSPDSSGIACRWGIVLLLNEITAASIQAHSRK